ncbi:MAG TPA: hypothetical protein VIM93_05060 [Kangiella sp.]|uniref:hypothetical protein n=1 Tax=Kangiella sp. TaxID=1920245 RepID=UPI002F937850
MFTKLTIFICLLSFSFNSFACGGSSSSLMEDLLIIISFGLILACAFMLPLSVVLFNTHYRPPHTAYFIGYFACTVVILTLMFYVNNAIAFYLTVLLCLFCAMPTIHTLLLAISQNKHAGKKRAAD